MYEVEYRDPRHREHEVTVEAEIGPIARQLIIWPGGRHFPGKPNEPRIHEDFRRNRKAADTGTRNP